MAHWSNMHFLKLDVLIGECDYLCLYMKRMFTCWPNCINMYVSA